MTNNFSIWNHLSPIAQQMLRTLDVQQTIGHSDTEIDTFLKTSVACLDIPPFRDFMLRYAGLKLDAMSPLSRSELSFSRIESNLRVAFSKKHNQWRLFIGETSSGAELNLTESGDVFVSRPGGYRVTLAESIDTIIEQCALLWAAHRSGMIVDRVSTSMNDGARCLAKRHGLAIVSKASDSYGRCWIGKDVGIVTSPSFCRRFLVAAYWPRHETSLDRHWTQELASLLEPHMRPARQSDGYKRYRDSGDVAELSGCVGRESGLRAADSFQVAVQNGLTALSQQGRVTPLPEEKAQLREYFKKEAEFGKQQQPDSLVVYFCSLGLLSVGDIDAFPMILDHMPLGEGTGWGEPLWGAAFLHFLFPCDFYFDPVKDALWVRNWYEHNRQAFIWNDTEGIYERG